MSGSTVLIVDDEQTLARSAKAFLADHGYEAEVAASGEKALELLESLQPDVIFADVRLPGMSGIDLLKRIRLRGRAGASRRAEAPGLSGAREPPGASALRDPPASSHNQPRRASRPPR